MADLTRKDIRQGIVTRLRAVTTAPLVNASIYDFRSTPVAESEGAVVIVSTPAQRDEKMASGQANFRHITTVIIESHLSANVDGSDPVDQQTLAAALDDLDEQICVTLLTDPTWVDDFGMLDRIEHSTAIDPSKSTRRGICRTVFDLEGSRVYQPDSAYYAALAGVDVTDRMYDEGTETPIPAADGYEQTIDLPPPP